MLLAKRWVEQATSCQLKASYLEMSRASYKPQATCLEIGIASCKLQANCWGMDRGMQQGNGGCN